MKTQIISLWGKIKTPILPLILGGVFLLLLWWNWYTRTQITDAPLFVSEYYACDKTATLPCISPSSWDIISWNTNTYTLSDNSLIFSPKHYSRAFFVRQLIAQGFTWFVTIPYPSSSLMLYWRFCLCRADFSPLC